MVGIVRHLTVGPRSERIHLEEKTVPEVQERIEDDDDPVVHVELRVAGELSSHDGAGIPVVADDPEVQVVAIVEDPDFRLFRRLRLGVRLLLEKASDRGSLGPNGLVEDGVDPNGHRGPVSGGVRNGVDRGDEPKYAQSENRTHVTRPVYSGATAWSPSRSSAVT